MPRFAQASKWFAVVTVPPTRLDVRTDQYCWNVEVPRIEGSLVRVVSRMSYVPPSVVTVPFSVAALEGL
jgi:hypothetical protein